MCGVGAGSGASQISLFARYKEEQMRKQISKLEVEVAEWKEAWWTLHEFLDVPVAHCVSAVSSERAEQVKEDKELKELQEDKVFRE